MKGTQTTYHGKCVSTPTMLALSEEHLLAHYTHSSDNKSTIQANAKGSKTNAECLINRHQAFGIGVVGIAGFIVENY